MEHAVRSALHHMQHPASGPISHHAYRGVRGDAGWVQHRERSSRRPTGAAPPLFKSGQKPKGAVLPDFMGGGAELEFSGVDPRAGPAKFQFRPVNRAVLTRASQKLEWHAKHPVRPGKGDVEPPVCAQGLWAWSRHPNLFFEIAFQWCLYAIVSPVERPAVVACPLLLTAMILFLPGGVIPQEIARRKLYCLYPSYVRYTTDTPTFFPFPLARSTLGACAPRISELVCLEVSD